MRRARPPTENGIADDDDDGMRRWEGSKYLSDRERDEIDLRGKMILRRSRERVKVLEEGEKGESCPHTAGPARPARPMLTL